ncbi:hypothetical protein SHPE106448_05745 [Shewanella pealeana]
MKKLLTVTLILAVSATTLTNIETGGEDAKQFETDEEDE